MIVKVLGVISGLAMIMITVIIIGMKFAEYGFGLPLFFVSSIATFSLLIFGSVVVSLSFHIDSELNQKIGGKDGL